MEIYGYTRSNLYTTLTWISILASGFILRLVFFWRPHWMLYFTSRRCSLREAQKVLLIDIYNQYFVEDVQHIQGGPDIAKLLPRGSFHKQDKDEMLKCPDDWAFHRQTTSSRSASLTSPTNNPDNQQQQNNDDSTYGSLITRTNSPSFVYFSDMDHKLEFNSEHSIRYFENKKIRYIWDDSVENFNRLRGFDKNVTFNKLRSMTSKGGLSDFDRATRARLYGENAIHVDVQPYLEIMFTEVLGPFYIFQVFSCVVWILEDYMYYGVCIVIMSIASLVSGVIQIRQNQEQLRDKVESDDIIKVLRGGKGANNYEEVRTSTLVPGDIVAVPTFNTVLQFDGILLDGNVIVNESMLTGESVPVTKTALPLSDGKAAVKNSSSNQDTSIYYDEKEHGKHTLFSGTTILQTRYYSGVQVKALVIRTGYQTTKGELIRSIMFPKPVDFKFNNQIHKFVGILACLAITGFSYSIFLKTKRGENARDVIMSALDLITIVVPPALPAAMTIGIIYAQSRLKKRKIFCISPRNINISGCIDCVCFDKTGTLTEDNLSFNEVRPVNEQKCCFSTAFDASVMQTNSKQVERDNHLLSEDGNYSPLMQCLAACHSLTIIDNKIVGDPLDLQMFEATGWVLEEPDVDDEKKFDLLAPTVVRPPRRKRRPVVTSPDSSETDTYSADDETGSNKTDSSNFSANNPAIVGDKLEQRCSRDVGILRQFPFSSSLQRMSVITRQFSGNQYVVYTKGAPEKIASLCDPETVPDDFAETLHSYTNNGFRVLALAYRPLKASLSYARMQRAGRQEIEKDLKLLGLLTLGNILKAQTIPVIRTLNAAQIRCIMVTGDNIQTAVSVARECGIIANQDRTILLELENNSTTPTKSANQQQQAKPMTTIQQEAKKLEEENIYRKLSLDGDDNTQSTKSGRKPSIVLDANIVASVCGTSSASSSCSSTRSIRSHTSRRTTNNENEPILSPRILREPPPRPKLVWKMITNETTLGKTELVEEQNSRHFKCFIEESRVHLALTGSTWTILLQHYPELVNAICVRGAVFARMAPDQKQQLVEQLQSLDYYVGMCGDGANDSGALRVAHTGISLSDTEASVAAPFTSSNPDISCVPILISEGRAALVTAFGILKYMALYSLTQFCAVMILYAMFTNFTDLEYLFEDLFIITSLATVFGRTKPYHLLDKRSPSNSLISIEQLSSIGIHIVLVVFFQVITLVIMWQTPWYEPHPQVYDEELAGHDNIAIFSMSCFQCISLAVVFSKGKPYRKSILSNKLLFGTVIALTAITATSILLVGQPAIAWFLPIISIPWQFKLLLIALGFTYFIVALVSERLIVDHILFKKQDKFLEIFGLSSKITKHQAIERKIHSSNWPSIMVK